MSAVASFYGPLAAATFMLNMQLGSGVLLLPAAFADAGLGLASLFLLIVCVTAYISGSWVIEAMAIANHKMKTEKAHSLSDPLVPKSDEFELGGVENVEESTGGGSSSSSSFSLTYRVEMGALAQTFFPMWGQIITYTCFVIYTLGTLAAYALTITNTTLELARPVGYDSWTIVGIDAYYVFLLGFAIIVTPFCFGNFQNTKILQIVVVVVRFVAYAIMLVCPLIFIIAGDPVPAAPNATNTSTAAFDFASLTTAAANDEESSLPAMSVRYGLWGNTSADNGTSPWETASFWFNFEGISAVYGTAIFTFMIHHSIPGLVSPIRPEKHGRAVVGGTMFLVAFMYIVLCAVAMFAFDGMSLAKCSRGDPRPCSIQPLYSNNFDSYHVSWLGWFTEGYPILMIVLFPLIAISLRNNLMELYILMVKSCACCQRNTAPGADAAADLARRKNSKALLIISTFLAAWPPILLVSVERDIGIITTWTGNIPGVAIMLVIPACLVIMAKKQFPEHEQGNTTHRSPFARIAWHYAILAWSGACVVLFIVTKSMQFA